MIGIVIPAHNEAKWIGACLASVCRAAAALELRGEEVMIVVVLDACTDATASIAENAGVMTATISARNVGMARALGAELCLAAGTRWLAFTDADTMVAPDWLEIQLALDSEVVCGTVGVEEWLDYGDHMPRHFAATYQDIDGHRHIHGANLGISAAAYRAAGGFASLSSSEDVALVNAVELCGIDIAWSAAPRMTTSARREFRAPDGFGAALVRVDARALNLSLTA